MEQTISDVELAEFNAYLKGTNIDYTEVALTYTEVRAVNSAPTELVAAPGTGYVIDFISAVLIMDWVAGPYANNGALGIYETDATGQAVSDLTTLGAFLGLSADTIIVLQAVSADITLTANTPLVLSEFTGDSITGTSPVRVKTAYRIHATGL